MLSHGPCIFILLTLFRSSILHSFGRIPFSLHHNLPGLKEHSPKTLLVQATFQHSLSTLSLVIPCVLKAIEEAVFIVDKRVNFPHLITISPENILSTNYKPSPGTSRLPDQKTPSSTPRDCLLQFSVGRIDILPWTTSYKKRTSTPPSSIGTTWILLLL